MMEQGLFGFATRGVFLAYYSKHILENEETLDNYELARKSIMLFHFAEKVNS